MEIDNRRSTAEEDMTLVKDRKFLVVTKSYLKRP